jgi:lipopolysaccharide transport system permease protein
MIKAVENEPLKILTAEPISIRQYVREVIKFSSLIPVFALQEIKLNYAQTNLGVLWGVFRPLFTLLIFTVIFNTFLKIPTEKPYYLFAFTGMIAWNYFSQISFSASTAIISNQNLIRKMYFPKLILPFSKLVVSSIDYVISMIILTIMVLLEGNLLGLQILALPLFFILNVFCGLCIALWMNVLTIKLRDLNQIVPSIIGFAIWVTPVFYPTTIVPDKFQFLVYANPMSGIIKGYRYSFLGEPFPEWPYWIAIFSTVLLAILGAWKFAKTEDKMVDYA